MDIACITTAYDQLKLAQKNLNAYLDNSPDADARQRMSDVLTNILSAQDRLLAAREAGIRQEFENRFLREKIGQFEDQRQRERTAAELRAAATTQFELDRFNRP